MVPIIPKDLLIPMPLHGKQAGFRDSISYSTGSQITKKMADAFVLTKNKYKTSPSLSIYDDIRQPLGSKGTPASSLLESSCLTEVAIEALQRLP